MARGEIENPRISITLIFLLVAILSFVGIMSSASRTEAGFTILGNVIIVTGNIGFWGMVYRVSKHFQYYLRGRPGASFFRIVFVASFVVVFIFLFSFTSSFLRNSNSPSISEQDPFSLLKNEIENQKKSDQ